MSSGLEHGKWQFRHSHGGDALCPSYQRQVEE